MNEPIINGIDVSECKYFNKVVNEEPYCNMDEEHLYTCSSDENCYYKQLKRLQEENKELKEKNKGLLNLCNNGGALLATESAKTKKYKQALENMKQFLIFADHSNTGNKYFENVEKVLNIANEVLNDRN